MIRRGDDQFGPVSRMREGDTQASVTGHAQPVAPSTGHAAIDAATTDAREPDFFREVICGDEQFRNFIFGVHDVCVLSTNADAARQWLMDRKETLGAMDPYQVSRSFAAEWAVDKRKE